MLRIVASQERLGGSGLQHLVAPRLQHLDWQLHRTYMVEAGLHDGHAYTLDVVLKVELVQRTKRIDHHLGVAVGVHSHALAVFEVYDLHQVVGHDDGVGGAERLRQELREVEPRLHKQLRILGVGSGAVEVFHHRKIILLDMAVHLA